jgi:hypothetical protein
MSEHEILQQLQKDLKKTKKRLRQLEARQEELPAKRPRKAQTDIITKGLDVRILPSFFFLPLFLLLPATCFFSEKNQELHEG